MSAEKYFETNVAGNEFANYISKKRANEPQKSPPRIIVEELADSAASGLKELKDSAFNRSRSARQLGIDSHFNVSTLFFSAMTLTIEQMVWDKTFCLADLVADINSRTLSGWGSANLSTSVPTGPIEIPDGEWYKLIEDVNRDKTYSNLFKNEALFPEVARRIYTSSPYKNTIQNKIIPQYQPLAALVCK